MDLDADTCNLGYREPFDWATLLGFLEGRAIPGVERVSGDGYSRTIRLGDAIGWVRIRHDAPRRALRAEVSPSLAGHLMPLSARLRALFDLDAHPAAIAAHLGRDPALSALVRRRPGLRVPGAYDGFEMTVRAVLGQQVSVRAATTISGRLAERFGEPSGSPEIGLERLFPAPERIAAATEDEIAALGMPGARARAILALARAVAAGEIRLDRHGDGDATLVGLRALPGFGAWTTQYVAMRALRWPDAFPASDLGIRKALGGLSPRAAEARAEPWRPWRAYAVMHLWTSL